MPFQTHTRKLDDTSSRAPPQIMMCTTTHGGVHGVVPWRKNGQPCGGCTPRDPSSVVVYTMSHEGFHGAIALLGSLKTHEGVLPRDPSWIMMCICCL